MFNIARIEELISISESTLQKYNAEHLNSPSSLFVNGMIKNTTERIEELRANLAFEKRLREKEVIDLRLKGKLAKMGRLPLELLGNFAKQISGAVTEAGRHYQFGSKIGSKVNEQVKSTINLEFERLVPGSTRLLITGDTNPDLFGNSILENALINTFYVLNSDVQGVLEASEKIGGTGIKRISSILTTATRNELEFDLEWKAPNDKQHTWIANRDTIQGLNNTISKIHIAKPETIYFTASIVMQSIKGVMEVQDSDDGKKYKLRFPLSMLEKIKQFQIEDTCFFAVSQKTIKNTITGDERNTYQLIEIG
jgi:hypothetical protein